jgi:hypothetical protein
MRRQRSGQSLAHSPRQEIQFSLKRPLIHMPRQTCANRIVEDVMPFRIIILRTPQLRVPEIALPDRLLMRTRPISGCNAFPVADPLHQRLGRKYSRCTKRVNMIRHYDVAADTPRPRLLPCIQYHRHRIGMREERLAILAADREKNDDVFVESFANWRMRGTFAVLGELNS